MNSADNLLKRNEYVEALKRMEDGDFFLLENSIKAMFDFNFRAYTPLIYRWRKKLINLTNFRPSLTTCLKIRHLPAHNDYAHNTFVITGHLLNK